MNRWLKLVFIAIAAVLVVEVVLRRDAPPPPPTSRADDVDAKTAPDAPDLALPTLGGKTIDLRSLRGRVVAVNFWATWCEPCRVEMPRLAEIWRARRDRCFELLGVAGMSSRSEVEKVARDIPFPVVFDYAGDSLDAWSVLSFPRTFVVDAQGRVRREFRGLVDEQELERTIDRLLPASCPPRSG